LAHHLNGIISAYMSDWFTAHAAMITAAATVVYAFITVLLWLQTKKSADAAMKSAEAAKLNAEVLLEGHRPQIAARAHGSPTRDLSDRKSPRVQIALTNQGNVPAYDLTYESWIELLPLPFDDFTSSADYFKSTDKITLYPKHQPLIVNIPIRTGVTDAQLSDLRQLRLYACIRIRVTYRDVLSAKSRYANFGFHVLGDGLGFLPQYNDSN
jgi:hypothetical protein